jgi:hypothetical protein
MIDSRSRDPMLSYPPDRYDALVRRMRMALFVRAGLFVVGAIIALAFGFHLAPFLPPLSSSLHFDQ